MVQYGVIGVGEHDSGIRLFTRGCYRLLKVIYSKKFN